MQVLVQKKALKWRTCVCFDLITNRLLHRQQEANAELFQLPPLLLIPWILLELVGKREPTVTELSMIQKYFQS